MKKPPTKYLKLDQVLNNLLDDSGDSGESSESNDEDDDENTITSNNIGGKSSPVGASKVVNFSESKCPTIVHHNAEDSDEEENDDDDDSDDEIPLSKIKKQLNTKTATKVNSPSLLPSSSNSNSSNESDEIPLSAMRKRLQSSKPQQKSDTSSSSCSSDVPLSTLRKRLVESSKNENKEVSLSFNSSSNLSSSSEKLKLSLSSSTSQNASPFSYNSNLSAKTSDSSSHYSFIGDISVSALHNASAVAEQVVETGSVSSQSIANKQKKKSDDEDVDSDDDMPLSSFKKRFEKLEVAAAEAKAKAKPASPALSAFVISPNNVSSIVAPAPPSFSAESPSLANFQIVNTLGGPTRLIVPSLSATTLQPLPPQLPHLVCNTIPTSTTKESGNFLKGLFDFEELENEDPEVARQDDTKRTTRSRSKRKQDLSVVYSDEEDERNTENTIEKTLNENSSQNTSCFDDADLSENGNGVNENDDKENFVPRSPQRQFSSCFKSPVLKMEQAQNFVLSFKNIKRKI